MKMLDVGFAELYHLPYLLYWDECSDYADRYHLHPYEACASKFAVYEQRDERVSV